MKKLFIITLLAATGYLSFKNKDFIIEKYQHLTQVEAKQDSSRTTEVSTHKKLPNVQKTLPAKPHKKLRFYNSYKIATKIPKSVTQSIETLAKYISNKSATEKQKAEIIYSWIAQNIGYDDNGYNTNKYGDLSAEGVLKSRKAVCEGYSNIFKELCNSCGLKSIKITGYSKGYSYVEGKKPEKNHAWNSVKINNNWELVDVTWGAGYGKKVNGKLKTYKEFDDYWFCTKPEEFIYKHLPEIKKYQKLSPPISFETFQTMNAVNADLFELGFPSHKILSFARSNKGYNAPKAYSPNLDLKILKAPLRETISNKNLVKIKVSCKEDVEIALINEGQWTYLKQNDNIYEIEILPKKGNLKLCYKLNNYEKSFWTVLEYEVKN